MQFYEVKKDLVLESMKYLLRIQKDFKKNFGVDDIFSNSKVFEVVIANRLDHILIPGHSGSRDVTDKNGIAYEYKHYKESSSNHSWTFNDYSEAVFEKMEKDNYGIIFAHMDDTNGTPRKKFNESKPEKIKYPELDWYYDIPGILMSEYLREATKRKVNARKMINVSRRQIKLNFDEPYNCKKYPTINFEDGRYSNALNSIFDKIKHLEKETKVVNLLTSNKIWELITSIHLNHNVNPEQGGRLGAHDAYDEELNQYEYKISKSGTWNFQDISENVLKKYESVEEFILAIKNVDTLSINLIYCCNKELINKIRSKMKRKEKKHKEEGTIPRRKQISLTRGDIAPYIIREIPV